MKKYIKPSLEYIDLTVLGRLMTGGLEGASAGGGIGGTDSTDPHQGGQGFAPGRRVF